MNLLTISIFNLNMKKVLVLFLSIVFFLNCTSSNTLSSISDLSGTYKGDISVYINNQYHSTLYNHSISFTKVASSNEYLLEGSLLIANTCSIENNLLSIQETTSASTTHFQVVEFANGNFREEQLEIEFYQNQVNPVTSEIGVSGKWIGTLRKVN